MHSCCQQWSSCGAHMRRATTRLAASALWAPRLPHIYGKQLIKCQAYSSALGPGSAGFGHQQHQPEQQQQPPQQQQQERQQQLLAQQHGTVKQALPWQHLHRAAQIAAWSGLCYQLPPDLETSIQQQPHLNLVAYGRNEYTAWYIADGVIPHSQFCISASQRGISSNSSDGIAASPTNGSMDQDACQTPPARRERFVILRGVQWSAPDINSMKVSQALMRLWPTPFPHAHTRGLRLSSNTASGNNQTVNSSISMSGGPQTSTAAPATQLSAAAVGTNGTAAAAAAPAPLAAAASFWQATAAAVGSAVRAAPAASAAQADDTVPLVAHEGVAQIAESLFDQLRPYLDQADDVGMPICFAGHSLGGSLAMLTLVLYELHHRRRHPGIRPTCYTFGSPPVLSHRQGGGGQRVLDALHLPPDTIRDFVLEHDPVPRALLSVDPAFQMLKGWSAVKGLLQLRELLAGEGSPLSPTRFLFEAVGQVYLVRWTQEGGSEVVSLDAHEIESALSLAATNAADPSTAAGEAAAATTATATAVTQADSTPTSTVGPDSIITASTATPVGEGGVTVPSTAAGQATAASNTASASPSWFDPTRTMQAMLDHYHGSYAQELEAAALSALKREMPR